MMAPQFLRNTFTIRPAGRSGDVVGALRAGLAPSGEELEVARKSPLLSVSTLGVWKGSRAKMSVVTYAHPSTRTRGLAGARRRLAGDFRLSRRAR